MTKNFYLNQFLTTITFLFILTSCSSKTSKVTIDISGNWKTSSIKEAKIEEYLEYYITKNEIYVLSEYGLINTFNYSIDKNLIFHANDTITNNDPIVIIGDDQMSFQLMFRDSTNILSYSKINKGILPEVYINNKELKDCYYKSFFFRFDEYDNTVKKKID